MELVVLAVFVVVAGSVGATAWMTRRNRWRWGTEAAGPVAAGAGAYRSAMVSVVRERQVPWTIPASAVAGFVWSAATGLVFAPAGMLLALVLWDDHAFACGGLVAVCLDGFALSVALVAVGVGLLRCRRSAFEHARRIAVWSGVHHVGVLGAFACLLLGEDGLIPLACVSVPCLVGMGQALLLHRAGSEPPPEIPDWS